MTDGIQNKKNTNNPDEGAEQEKSFSKKTKSSKGCDGIENLKALLPAYLGYWFICNNSNTLLTLMSRPYVSPK